jgi:methionine sulfoxide reductase heme-binding subunit
MLWNDRAGRFSPLKLATLLIAIAPGLWVAYSWAMDDLGAKPLTEAIHEIGIWAVRFLVATLAIRPARRLLNWPKIMTVRRMLGVTTMVYALIHLSLYIFQQHFNLLFVASEIALRFYLTIGFVALLGLVALGWTSTDGWIKRLGGQRWQLLHKSVYVIGVLALYHFALQLKIDVTQAVLMTGLFAWLMGYRVIEARRWPVNLLSLTLLSLAAGLGTALIEAAWYAVGTGIQASLILQANLDFSTDIRPAWWVLAAGLAASLLFLGRSWLKARAAQGVAPGRGRAVADQT